MTEDIERLALVQDQVIKLRRLATETLDREVSVRLHALANQIEQRAREADSAAVLSKISSLKSTPFPQGFGHAIKNVGDEDLEIVQTWDNGKFEEIDLTKWVQSNLIMNAIEAMSGEDEGTRELLISTQETEPNGVLVGVRDSGPGLAPTTLERVFETFYTTKSSGLGMGLSVCRSIVEAQGGRLWATAHTPRGAFFQFTIPARPA